MRRSSLPHAALPRLPLLAATAMLALGAHLSPAEAQVGRTVLAVGGSPVVLSYPTDAPARTVRSGPFEIEVAPDAAPRPSASPRRLMVISHGTAGSALPDQALASALAGAGFVVAQPLHAGDNYLDASQAGPVAFRRRPQEVVQLIDALATDPAWGPRLALDRVGVHGMSAGGVTGLALAGAQWRTLSLVQHCQQHLQQDIGFCFNGALTAEQQAARSASYDRARDVPEAYLPADMTRWEGGRTPPAEQPDADPRPDPRIAVVTLAVPVSAIFSAESLARVRIPVGVLGADHDEVLVPDFHSRHVLRHCGACTSLGELKGGGHFDVLWPWPPEVATQVAAQQVRGGLPVPGFDAAERVAAQARIVEFHRRVLQPQP